MATTKADSLEKHFIRGFAPCGLVSQPLLRLQAWSLGFEGLWFSLQLLLSPDWFRKAEYGKFKYFLLNSLTARISPVCGSRSNGRTGWSHVEIRSARSPFGNRMAFISRKSSGDLITGPMSAAAARQN